MGAGTPGRTVLVADPEPSVLRILVLVSHQIGCQTKVAHDSETAWQIIQEEAPGDERDLCAVVLDSELPPAGAAELTQRIRADQRSAHLPVLLLSIYGEPEGHLADAFLAKPFDIEDFASTLARLVGVTGSK
jgi:CheY-like chemotaxis protein